MLKFCGFRIQVPYKKGPYGKSYNIIYLKASATEKNLIMRHFFKTAFIILFLTSCQSSFKDIP